MSRIIHLPRYTGAAIDFHDAEATARFRTVSIAPEEFAKDQRYGATHVVHDRFMRANPIDEVLESMSRSLVNVLKPKIAQNLDKVDIPHINTAQYRADLYMFTQQELRDYAIKIATEVIKQCGEFDEEACERRVRQQVAKEITNE